MVIVFGMFVNTGLRVLNFVFRAGGVVFHGLSCMVVFLGSCLLLQC